MCLVVLQIACSTHQHSEQSAATKAADTVYSTGEHETADQRGEKVNLSCIYLGKDTEDIIVLGTDDNEYKGIVVAHTPNLSSELQVGQNLQITYSGAMTHSLPPQITAEEIIAGDRISEPVELSFTEANQVRELLPKVNYIDVRTPEEYAEGHLPQVLNVPLQDLDKHLHDFDITVPTFVYCRSGARSAEAAKLLVGAGYTVFDLGGILDYSGELVEE